MSPVKETLTEPKCANAQPSRGNVLAEVTFPDHDLVVLVQLAVDRGGAQGKVEHGPSMPRNHT